MRRRVVFLANQASTDEHRRNHPAQLLAWLRECADEADVIILTEVGSDAFRHVLLEFGRGRAGWVLCHPRGIAAGETAVLHRRSGAHTCQAQLLTEETIARGRLYATEVLHDHLTTVGTHLPRSVGDGPRLSRLAGQAVAYLGAVRGLRELVRSAAGPVVVGFDSNRNHRRRVVRRWLRRFLPGLHSCWSAPFPKSGTLGRRLVDAVWTNGRVVEAHLMEPVSFSDHRPFRVVIDWKVPALV